MDTKIKVGIIKSIMKHCFSHTSFDTAKRKVCMIGHRGYSSKHMENTAEAFIAAHKHGSGGVETDIRITKDGVFVCSHNPTVILETGDELIVAESTFAQLIAKPLKNKVKGCRERSYICTFERYLEICKECDMICFIEFKGRFSDAQIKDCLSLAERVYRLDKCLLQSADLENLIGARKMFPDLLVMQTWGQGDGDYHRCLELGFDIDADYRLTTRQMVEEFHDAGLKVGLWTANEPLGFAYCLDLNPDFIESDVY